MSAPDFLSSALATTISSLGGAETITIDSVTIPAIIDPETETEDLVLGGEGDHRMITLLVHSADLPGPPEKGGSVQLRGKDWNINSFDYQPQTTTRLTLHSPSRRS